jgi:hypothetical protein
LARDPDGGGDSDWAVCWGLFSREIGAAREWRKVSIAWPPPSQTGADRRVSAPLGDFGGDNVGALVLWPCDEQRQCAFGLVSAGVPSPVPPDQDARNLGRPGASLETSPKTTRASDDSVEAKPTESAPAAAFLRGGNL